MLKSRIDEDRKRVRRRPPEVGARNTQGAAFDTASQGVLPDAAVIIEEQAFIPDWELWEWALKALKEYGDKAPEHIAQLIGTLLLAGDIQGAAA